MSASWYDTKRRCKQMNKKKKNFDKNFFRLFERCLCVGNVSITHRGSFVLFSFYGESKWKWKWLDSQCGSAFGAEIHIFFCRFKNVPRIARIFWFIIISIKFKYCLTFHILSFKYFKECFVEFFALQLLMLTQSLATFAWLCSFCKFSFIG